MNGDLTGQDNSSSKGLVGIEPQFVFYIVIKGNRRFPENPSGMTYADTPEGGNNIKLLLGNVAQESQAAVAGTEHLPGQRLSVCADACEREIGQFPLKDGD